jgi:hypothetical protein
VLNSGWQCNSERLSVEIRDSSCAYSDSAANAAASRFREPAAEAPDVGDGDEFEVLFFGILQKGGNQRALHAVAAADDSGTDAIICADDGSIACYVPGDDGCGTSAALPIFRISLRLLLSNAMFSPC